MTPNTKTDSTAAPSRRDEILAAAASVIADRGIKQATVRDIGDAAGILSGSLYYHFESKDQIVLELLLPAIQKTYERASQICAESQGIEAVRELIHDSVLATAKNPERSIILRNEARTLRELELLTPVDDYRMKVVELWFRAMEQGIESGEIRSSINADIVARAILDGTLGASRWFNGTREAEPHAVAEALSDFYIGGLAQS